MKTICWNNGIHGLQNGSYTAERDGKFYSYMNGDFMGEIARVPKHQTYKTNVATANKYLPKCCAQRVN